MRNRILKSTAAMLFLALSGPAQSTEQWWNVEQYNLHGTVKWYSDIKYGGLGFVYIRGNDEFPEFYEVRISKRNGIFNCGENNEDLKRGKLVKFDAGRDNRGVWETYNLDCNY